MTSRRLVVVSNRGPLRVRGSGARRRVERASGGLVTALDPMLRERGGVWVSAPETDQPPHEDVLSSLGYRIAPVTIPRRVTEAFYGPMSNGVLWPTLHSMPATVGLGTAPWAAYVAANEAFADAAREAGGPESQYWIHDYHLLLVPGLLRARDASARIGWFCHVPWPSSDLFATLPWRVEMLEGMLGADLLGFHTDGYGQRFLECVARLTDHEVDEARRVVRFGGREVRVITAPIGIPWDDVQALSGSADVERRLRHVRREIHDRPMILGVDRLDYTKGVPERLRAFERLLARKPSYRRGVVLVQVMVPSREAVRAYRDLKDEVDRMVGDINGRYSVTGRVPIHYYYRSLSPVELYAHYRAADVALVTPLRDGMNLVAQEYCAARVGEDGVLVLSEFAGAATYLQDALRVNPHDVEATTEALATALAMPRDEQARRMSALRGAVRALDVHDWAAAYLAALEAA